MTSLTWGFQGHVFVSKLCTCCACLFCNPILIMFFSTSVRHRDGQFFKTYTLRVRTFNCGHYGFVRQEEKVHTIRYFCWSYCPEIPVLLPQPATKEALRMLQCNSITPRSILNEVTLLLPHSTSSKPSLSKCHKMSKSHYSVTFSCNTSRTVKL